MDAPTFPHLSASKLYALYAQAYVEAEGMGEDPLEWRDIAPMVQEIWVIFARLTRDYIRATKETIVVYATADPGMDTPAVKAALEWSMKKLP